MIDTLTELKGAARMLWRAPGYTTAAILLFALGIAATTSLFAILKAVVLDPLPYPRAYELMEIHESRMPDFPRFAVATGKFALWERENRSFAGLAMSESQSWTLTGQAEPKRVQGARVTTGFFEVLGTPMLLGGDFSTRHAGSELAFRVVLSESAWRRWYAADPTVLGRVVQLNGASHTIVGVAPKLSAFDADLFVPWSLDAADLGRFGSHTAAVIGRLKPGVTTAEGLADLNRIAVSTEQVHAVSQGWRVTMQSLPEAELADLRGVLRLLLGAAAMVLLIAVLNIACLGLLRAAQRQREFDARAALGASNARLARQVLTESLLLALAGGILGTLISSLVCALLRQSSWLQLPRVELIDVDIAVLGVSVGASLLAGALAAWLPTRATFQRTRRGGQRAIGRGVVGGHGRLRSALVVGEVTLAVLLLIGTGLLARSLLALGEVSPGFAPQQLQYTRITLPEERYPDGAAQAQFQRQLLTRLATQPGVGQVALAHAWPFIEDNWLALEIAGQPMVDAQQPPTALYYQVSPSVLSTAGLQLLRGRWLTDSDRADAPSVVVVSRSMALRYFGAADPLGQRIQTSKTGEVWAEIVGVVEDTRQYGLDAELAPQVYLPLNQVPRNEFFLLVRSPLAGGALRSALQTAVSALDGGLPVPTPEAMSERMAQAMLLRNLLFWLVSSFGLTALLLAGVGLYSTIAYSVSLAQREYGLRIALGASAGWLLAGVLRQGSQLALVGAVLGLGLALVGGSGLQAWIYGVSAFDPLTFILVPLTMLCIAILACLWPALRVARMGPMAALRSQD